MQKKYLFASNFSSLKRSHVGSLLTNHELKRLNCDVAYIAATHAHFVHNVSYMECQAQHGNGCVVLTAFKC